MGGNRFSEPETKQFPLLEVGREQGGGPRLGKGPLEGSHPRAHRPLAPRASRRGLNLDLLFWSLQLASPCSPTAGRFPRAPLLHAGAECGVSSLPEASYVLMTVSRSCGIVMKRGMEDRSKPETSTTPTYISKRGTPVSTRLKRVGSAGLRGEPAT